LYPTVEASSQRPSRKLLSRGFVLTEDDMIWAEQNYFGSDPELAANPRVSPLLAPSHAGQCPALVVTAGFDPLRDEGNAYAAALRDAGVDVQHIELEGLVHGFLHMVSVSRAARRGLDRTSDAIRARVRTAPIASPSRERASPVASAR
jgi:acetyl esterase